MAYPPWARPSLSRIPDVAVAFAIDAPDGEEDFEHKNPGDSIFGLCKENIMADPKVEIPQANRSVSC